MLFFSVFVFCSLDNSLILMVGYTYKLDISLDVTSLFISDKILWTLSSSSNLSENLLWECTYSWHCLHSQIISEPSSDSFLLPWKLHFIWWTSTIILLLHLSHKHGSHSIFFLDLYHILICFNITKKSSLFKRGSIFKFYYTNKNIMFSLRLANFCW